MKRGLAALALVPGIALGYPDGAPPGHTAAFGEPGCDACHFDAVPRPAGDRVRLRGLPARPVPGQRYRLVLELGGAPPAAGFQLAVRHADGRQAGALEPADDATSVVEHGRVLYLGHTRATGSRWAFWWTPASAGEARFHVVLNSANDDRSEFGDELLLFEALTRMEDGR